MPAFSRFLRYFLAVAHHGSIRKAAEELHVSPSAVHRQILNGEEEIGMPLFERLPSGLRLTAAGEIMMAAGNRWQKGLGSVRAQIEDLRGLKRGHVEIAVIDALTKGFLPSVIQAVQAAYPGISIGLRVLDNDSVRIAITEGRVDFGIFFDPQSFRDLTVRAFTEVVLGFVTPAGHPFGARAKARFSACAGERMVVPAYPLAVSQQVLVLEGTTGVTIDRAISSDNIQMITSLVASGVGIGILTSLDVVTELHRGLLDFTRIAEPILRPMTLALCIAKHRAPSYAASIVLTEIENGFYQLEQPDSAASRAGRSLQSMDKQD